MPTLVLLSFLFVIRFFLRSHRSDNAARFCVNSVVFEWKWNGFFFFCFVHASRNIVYRFSKWTWENNIHLLSLPLIQQPLGFFSLSLPAIWKAAFDFLSRGAFCLCQLLFVVVVVQRQMNVKSLLLWHLITALEMSLWIIKMFALWILVSFRLCLEAEKNIERFVGDLNATDCSCEKCKLEIWKNILLGTFLRFLNFRNRQKMLLWSFFVQNQSNSN